MRATRDWVTQQARQVAWTVVERAEPVRWLIRDRDRKFTRSFDDVFGGAGIRIVRAPIQAPQANAIGTIRSDGPFRVSRWLLILSAGHLERILTVYVDHYNQHRPHRSLDLTPPNGPPVPTLDSGERMEHDKRFGKIELDI